MKENITIKTPIIWYSAFKNDEAPWDIFYPILEILSIFCPEINTSVSVLEDYSFMDKTENVFTMAHIKASTTAEYKNINVPKSKTILLNIHNISGLKSLI